MFEKFSDSPAKECSDCKTPMTFEEFRSNNPGLSHLRAWSIWNDPVLSILCPKCFFNAPEKPYKVKRRDAPFYYRKAKE